MTLRMFAMRKSLLRLLAGALIAAALSGCSRFDGPTRDAMVAEALGQNFAGDFAKLEFLEGGYERGPGTSLRYSGANSRVLVLSKPKAYRSNSWPRQPHASMSGLAKTQGGRYFVFTYNSVIDAPSAFGSEPCLEADCRYFNDYRSVTEQDAQSWLFYRRELFTPELYRQIFGVDAPPREIPA